MFAVWFGCNAILMAFVCVCFPLLQIVVRLVIVSTSELPAADGETSAEAVVAAAAGAAPRPLVTKLAMLLNALVATTTNVASPAPAEQVNA